MLTLGIFLGSEGYFRNVKFPSSPYKRGREGTCKRIHNFWGLSSLLEIPGLLQRHLCTWTERVRFSLLSCSGIQSGFSDSPNKKEVSWRSRHDVWDDKGSGVCWWCSQDSTTQWGACWPLWLCHVLPWLHTGGPNVALVYLLKNKAEGLCFVQMSEEHRIMWLKTYLSTTNLV
jgi:hypothetical protein